MDKTLIFFTAEQGNLLIRLVLAHLLADFVFQTKAMVTNKNWFSSGMWAHIGELGLVTLVCSLNWQLTLVITLTHWIIDGVKMKLQPRLPEYSKTLFFADQALHLLVISLLWAVWSHCEHQLIQVVLYPFQQYAPSLLVLAYVWIIWPTGYLLKYALEGIAKTNGQTVQGDKIEHGGKLIGQFERTIILTFVLMGQYEAIGFLITGKGIIRFAQNDENLRSEYILVGTMMSYAISILTGVVVSWLIAIAS